MPTVDLTKDNFEQTVNENPLVIIDFWPNVNSRIQHLNIQEVYLYKS